LFAEGDLRVSADGQGGAQPHGQHRVRQPLELASRPRRKRHPDNQDAFCTCLRLLQLLRWFVFVVLLLRFVRLVLRRRSRTVLGRTRLLPLCRRRILRPRCGLVPRWWRGFRTLCWTIHLRLPILLWRIRLCPIRFRLWLRPIVRIRILVTRRRLRRVIRFWTIHVWAIVGRRLTRLRTIRLRRRRTLVACR